MTSLRYSALQEPVARISYTSIYPLDVRTFDSGEIAI